MAEERRKENTMIISFRENKGGENDIQNAHVREEDADSQRAERGGYRRGVHAPRWWLPKNTRSARARRE